MISPHVFLSFEQEWKINELDRIQEHCACVASSTQYNVIWENVNLFRETGMLSIVFNENAVLLTNMHVD